MTIGKPKSSSTRSPEVCRLTLSKFVHSCIDASKALAADAVEASASKKQSRQRPAPAPQFDKAGIANAAFDTKNNSAKLSRMLSLSDEPRQKPSLDDLAAVIDACHRLLENQVQLARDAGVDTSYERVERQIANGLGIESPVRVTDLLVSHRLRRISTSLDYQLADFMTTSWWAGDFRGAHTPAARRHAASILALIRSKAHQFVDPEDRIRVGAIAASAATQFLPGTDGNLQAYDELTEILNALNLFGLPLKTSIDADQADRALRVLMRHQWVLLTPHVGSMTHYLPLVMNQKRLPGSVWAQIQKPLHRILAISQERMSLFRVLPDNTMRDSSSCMNFAARMELLYRGDERAGDVSVNASLAKDVNHGRRAVTTDQYELASLIASDRIVEACRRCDEAIQAHATYGHPAPVEALSALRLQLSDLPAGLEVEDPAVYQNAARAVGDVSRLVVTSHIFDAPTVTRVIQERSASAAPTEDQ